MGVQLNKKGITMMRPSMRKSDQMRPVSMETNVNKWAEGSCLIKVGGTMVLCTASVDLNQPLWKRLQNKTCKINRLLDSYNRGLQ